MMRGGTEVYAKIQKETTIVKLVQGIVRKRKYQNNSCRCIQYAGQKLQNPAELVPCGFEINSANKDNPLLGTWNYLKLDLSQLNCKDRNQPGSLIITYMPENPIQESFLITGIYELTRKRFVTTDKNDNEQWAFNLIYNDNEGFVIPYQKYIDYKIDIEQNPDIVFTIPEWLTPKFKSMCNELSSDDLIYIVENFIKIANTLYNTDNFKNTELGNKIAWLNTQLDQIWKQRGKYPGLPAMLDYLKFPNAVYTYKQKNDQGQEEAFFNEIKSVLQTGQTNDTSLRYIKYNWDQLDDNKKNFLLNYLVYYNIPCSYMEYLMTKYFDKKISAEKIFKNPYELCEEFVGDTVE